MALDAVNNFGKVTVSTTYDADDTSIVLSGGHGAKLPAPATAGAFNLVWWNSTDYADPADDPNVEIVRCTARSTDTLTVTRGQESLAASTKNDGGKVYKMILAPTAKMITDIGTLKNGTVNPTNLLSNGDFENWSAGASAAPDGWAFGGAGASIAREATTIKMGTYSAKLTRAGADCYAYQEPLLKQGLAYWNGRTVTFGAWVYATVASRAKLRIYGADGVYTDSSYHTGDSTWQWLAVTATINSNAVTVYLYLWVATGDTSAYFDGAMCVEGESAFAFADKPATPLYGTFVANGASAVTVSDTRVAITDAIVISLNTVGGTVGVQPHVATITGATGFTVVCTASDTSIYNYYLLKR